MNAKNFSSSLKGRLVGAIDKLENSKAYNVANKVSIVAGTTAVSLGTMAFSSFAASGVSVVLSEINSADIIDTAMPFINIGLPILCVVGGLNLGMRFLRKCLH